ncbi:GNAT family N-acetyltransferase [Bacillus horti]|uniref:Ribosomal protein S18 acetylase RimI-like enzyme n=1 Tax=Caldalkalibacillus horti TaxID=77523 RepID=A0ABT9VYN5_9BACI|nr:GNAT family N-acetyltransferase [Bacillus horti]MDQ0165720.1 ribosomal protein S18 acetylase RimI-like enzyme [Bacillus horti]
MISHHILTLEEINKLTEQINRDQQLLFYSYLTQRKETAIFIGQYIDGHLTAVLAYFSGLSFPAFSFHCIDRNDVDLPSLIKFTREYIQLKDSITCGTILSNRDLELFQSHSLITGTPQSFLTMKHVDQMKLLDSDMGEVVGRNDVLEVMDFLQNGDMRFFTREELEQYPYIGVKVDNQYVAVGGYHFYGSLLVEIGNIYTRPDYRGKGLAKHLTSQLTSLGKELSTDVHLGVLAQNLAAVHVYERLGYEIMAEQKIVDFKLGM